MRFEIDSERFETGRRLNAWRGILCDTYVGLDSGYRDENFRSVINGHTIGECSLTRVTATSPYHVERSRTLIKRDSAEVLFFGICLAVRFVMKQGGREALVEPGVIAFNDATRPFQTDFSESVGMVWLSVPKKAFADRVDRFEDLTAVAFGPTTPVQQITFDFLGGLGAVLDRGVPDADAGLLMNQAVDLLAMSVNEDALQTASPSALRATRLRRLKAYLDDHLYRADLSLPTTAAALSMSPFEVEALLASEKTSFADYLLTRRLDGCHAFLTSSGIPHISVADIASLWGFTDQALFQHAFRDRFGVTADELIARSRRLP